RVDRRPDCQHDPLRRLWRDAQPRERCMQPRMGVQPGCRRALHAGAAGRDHRADGDRPTPRRLSGTAQDLYDGTLAARLEPASRLSHAAALSKGLPALYALADARGARAVVEASARPLAKPRLALSDQRARGDAAEGEPLFVVGRTGARRQARQHVERARTRPVGIPAALRLQARVPRRLGRLRDRAVEFRGYVLSLREGLREGASLGPASDQHRRDAGSTGPNRLLRLRALHRWTAQAPYSLRERADASPKR